MDWCLLLYCYETWENAVNGPHWTRARRQSCAFWRKLCKGLCRRQLCFLYLAMMLVFLLYVLLWSDSFNVGSPKQAKCSHTCPLKASKLSIIFVKTFKCASSTAGGVLRRIAALNGLYGARQTAYRWWWSFIPEPKIWANHLNRRQLDRELHSLHAQYFTFTMVRNPGSRCLSHYYMAQSKFKVQSSLDAKLKYLRQHCHNTMFKYIQPPGIETVAGVLAAYNLIGIVERFDESMVVLAHLLQVPLHHVTFISAKNSSREQAYSTGQTVAVHPPFADEALAVKEYIDGWHWQMQNRLDLEIVREANSQLDHHIARIPHFADQLGQFRSLLATAQHHCSHLPLQAISQRDCLWNDNGCGFECLNSIDTG